MSTTDNTRPLVRLPVEADLQAWADCLGQLFEVASGEQARPRGEEAVRRAARLQNLRSWLVGAQVVEFRAASSLPTPNDPDEAFSGKLRDQDTSGAGAAAVRALVRLPAGDELGAWGECLKQEFALLTGEAKPSTADGEWAQRMAQLVRIRMWFLAALVITLETAHLGSSSYDDPDQVPIG